MSIDEININRQILERCKNGEVKAQFMLYKQYSKAMYNIAIRLMNNKMDAEDILQESFVTAFEKLGELTNNDAFGSWLKRIVINNCLTHLRHHMLESPRAHSPLLAAESASIKFTLGDRRFFVDCYEELQFDDIHDYAPAEFPDDEETELNLN